MKYRSKKAYIKLDREYTFDSKAELNYFILLHNKLKQGKISNLVLQPAYEISTTYKLSTNATKQGYTKIPAMIYTPDFSYIEDNKLIVVEVKGMKTTDYTMRKKLFLAIAYDKYSVDEFIEVVGSKASVYDCRSVGEL